MAMDIHLLQRGTEAEISVDFLTIQTLTNDQLQPWIRALLSITKEITNLPKAVESQKEEVDMHRTVIQLLEAKGTKTFLALPDMEGL
jgi:hypothetical protein